MRSSVAKAACAFIVRAARDYPREFAKESTKSPPGESHKTSYGAGNGIRYFKDDALFKLLNNGNRTLSDLGHQTIVEILEHNCEIGKLIPHLCAQINSKNTLVRLRTAKYYEIVLSKAHLQMIEANADLIDLFLIQSTDDQNQEVRNQARICFALYGQLMPDRSTVLLMHGIKAGNVRKSIVAELGLDLSELNQDLKRIATEGNDESISGYDMQAVLPIPMKERIQKLQARYDGAKTPEQLMRAQQRVVVAKSPDL